MLLFYLLFFTSLAFSLIAEHVPLSRLDKGDPFATSSLLNLQVATANFPGQIAWTCSSVLDGVFHMFGGATEKPFGYIYYNTLWKYDPETTVLTGSWSVLSGDPLDTNSPGNFVDKGNFSATAIPGARGSPLCSPSPDGTEMYVFGGESPGTNPRNDLWIWSNVEMKWKWAHGPSATLDTGNYGVKGVSNGSNLPPNRYGGVSTFLGTDFYIAFGRCWTTEWEYLGDIWKFDGTDWTFVAGGTYTTFGNYVDFGFWSTNFAPRGRYYPAAARVEDGQGGHLWALHGGQSAKNATGTFVSDGVIYFSPNDTLLWSFGGNEIRNLDHENELVVKPLFTFGGSPGFREQHKAVPLFDGLSFLIFSGSPAFDGYSDFWLFNGTQWALWGGSISTQDSQTDNLQPISFVAHPGQRTIFSMSRDMNDDQSPIYITGGWNEGAQNHYTSDMWLIYLSDDRCGYNGAHILNEDVCYCSQDYYLNFSTNQFTNPEIVNVSCVPAPSNMLYRYGINGPSCMEDTWRSNTTDPTLACLDCPENAYCNGFNTPPGCNPDNFLWGDVGSDCFPCPAGAVCLGDNIAPTCPETTYHTSMFKDCVPCPIGGSCSGDQALPEASSEYFKSESADLFMKCFPPQACSGSGGCSPEYSGYLCASCAPNHYRWNNECYSCGPAPGLNYLLLPFLLLIIAGGLIYGVASVRENKSPLSIFTDLFQMISIIGSIQIPIAPKWYYTFFSIFDFSFADTSALSPPECYLTTVESFYLKIVFIAILPFAVLFAILVLYAYHKFYFLKKHTELRPVPDGSGFSKLKKLVPKIHNWGIKVKDNVSHYYKGAANFLLFLSYPIVLRSMISVYSCSTLPDGSIVVSKSHNILCSDPTHTSWSVVAGIIIALFGIGFPAAALYQINFLRSSHLSEDTTDDDDDVMEDHFVIEWGFLFALTKPKFAYWDLFLLFRRVFAILLTSIFLEEPMTPSWIILLVSIFQLFFLGKYKPYIEETVNQISIIFALCLVVAASISTTYSGYSIAATIISIVLYLTPLFITALSIKFDNLKIAFANIKISSNTLIDKELIEEGMQKDDMPLIKSIDDDEIANVTNVEMTPLPE